MLRSRLLRTVAIYMIIVVFFVSSIIPIRSVHAAETTLVNVNNNVMDFGVPSVSGTSGSVNTIYLYQNVYTSGGIQVDAKVEIIGKSSNATLNNYDLHPTSSDVPNATTRAQIQKRFNPVITTTSGTGYLDYKISFINHATGDPVLLQNFYVTVIDIDGSSSATEFIEASGFESYTVNNPTGLQGLTPPTINNGRTRFTGIDHTAPSVSGLPEFDNSASVIVNYTAPISSLNMRVGNTGSLSNRQSSINFGAAGGVFSNPNVVKNPSSPTLTVSIGDGNDGYLKPNNDVLTAVPITGTTTAEAGRTVNISIKDSANHVINYTTTVQNGGTYSITPDLSSLPPGTITVTANVTNQGGNPATPVTDTTIKDAAPTASSVNITGTAKVGQVMTGGYTYGDVDSDVQGASTFKWYSGTQSNGSDKAPINGAVSTTYTLTNSEYGKYLFFEVTPVALTGTPVGAAVVSAGKGPVGDEAPTATNVNIIGTATIGQTVTGAYTYGDVDGDIEGTSTYKWYSGTQSNGSGKVAINGAVNTTYTITNAEYGKYLFFEVTPVAQTGTPVGAAVVSAGKGPVGDEAPTATNVNITGTAKVGQVLTGAYTYGDADNDLQGTSTFKWYIGAQSDGSDKVAINGAVSSTYTVTNADYGKYLFFEVTPIAQTGTLVGAPAVSIGMGPIGDVAPTATNVNITGTAKRGKTLTGSYTYGDADSDLEGTSTFKWYSGAQSDGSDKVAINGAVSTTYTITNAEYGEYLFFEVTPVAQTGTLVGTQAASIGKGPVEDVAPTATSVSITGTAKVGQVLTGSYTYGDADNDLQGTSTFKWYSGAQSDGSDKVAINGAVSTTYTITNAEYGKYLFFEVTPVAQTGTLVGTQAASIGKGPVEDVAPTATSVSITGTAKVGQVLTGSYTYGDADNDLQGTSTFKWYSGKQSDGSDKVAINGATSTAYTITNADYGKYLFFEVTPVALTGTLVGAPAVSIGKGPVEDVAPTAANVNIIGTAKVGQSVIGSYTYGDADNDLQGISTFKWYSGTQSDGSDKVAIDGAVSTTYTITNADYGKYLFFEVTPVALTGTLTGAPAVIGVKVNTPPVVHDVLKTGLAGAVIPFIAADFSTNPAYIDVDNDDLSHVQIILPSDFDTKGTLWYEASVTNVVYIQQGMTETLTKAQLDSLRFQPLGNLPNGSTVTFDWLGNDGKENSASPALVKIAYNGIPVSQPLELDAEEGTPFLTITLKGTDMETVTGIVYGIQTSPLKGTLVVAPQNNPNGDIWIYTPNNGATGKDSFTYTATDSDGQKSQPATVQIEINKLLEGWVGNKNQGDTTAVHALPGHVLKLSAVSSLQAAEVHAAVNGASEPLTFVNSSTYLSDGFKKWEKSVYQLPSGLAPGEYTVIFTASKADQSILPEELASKLGDNTFSIAAPAILQLKADPEKILGDGISTTTLTAVLKDANGNPIANTEVVFSAQGIGSFVGPDRAMTNSQGIASVIYKSEKITGAVEKQIPVKATVLDLEKGISAQDEIIVTFLPPTIGGVLTRGDKHEAIGGALIRATLDLNGDGKIEQGVDFDVTVTTNSDGSYVIPVPEGDREYNLEVTQMVTIGGVESPVTYNQLARVGTVTGNGETFESEKTATGVVLFKNQDGQSGLLNPAIVSKVKVYLKDANGTYITDGAGKPKAFALKDRGVFQAEGLTKDVNYSLEITYELEPGIEVIMKRSTVKVTANGEMNISQELVDPYGTVTDASTKNQIQGAQVILYFADTLRNRNNGRTPDTAVVLPAVPGFAPYDNKSPDQLTDPYGFYAYMVFPQADYYLTVTKAGYISQKSETISVEFDIVKRDFALVPDTSESSYAPPVQPEITLDITADKNLVKENEISKITVDYNSKSPSTGQVGTIVVTIPQGAEVINANGGIVTGNTITWTVNDLASNQKGSFVIDVKWPLLSDEEGDFELSGQFSVKGTAASSVKADSAVKVKVFSDRFGHLKHQRYILGYPDGMFKPNNSLTRAEIAAIVARLTENSTVNTPLSYTDISEKHWAANYVKIATKYGYFGGFEDGSFHPDSPVTRGELAAVMARFLKLKVASYDDKHFSDVHGYWASDAIEALYRGHFLSGYPDGTFKPQDNISRVEAVTLINRMLYRGPLKGIDPLFPDVSTSHWGYGDVLEATFSHESVRNLDGSESWKSKLEDQVK